MSTLKRTNTIQILTSIFFIRKMFFFVFIFVSDMTTQQRIRLQCCKTTVIKTEKYIQNSETCWLQDRKHSSDMLVSSFCLSNDSENSVLLLFNVAMRFFNNRTLSVIFVGPSFYLWRNLKPGAQGIDRGSNYEKSQ